MSGDSKVVAIIAPDFPPSGLPSALRVRLFARHLGDFGWRPIVISTDPRCYTHPVDPANERLLPESLEILRTSAIPASFARKFGIGDIGIRSLWHHWRALKKLCRTRRIDLVFISVPPSVSMVLGRLAFRKFGIPYVIDYQDPWITEYYWKLPAAARPPKWLFAYTLSRLLEPFAIRDASHVTAVSQLTADSVLSRYPRFPRNNSTEIPFGAEPADFEELRRNPRVNPVFDPYDGFLHIVYTGVCIRAMFPALCIFFGALVLAGQEDPGLVGRVRLHFVGTSYSATRAEPIVLPLAREFGLNAITRETTSRVPYLDSLQIMLDAHLLLLPGTDEPHYTASKVFPYMLASRPILAIVHQESTVATILLGSPIARVATLGEGTRTVAGHLRHLLQSQPATRPAVPESQTAREMTARLAGVFDRSAARRGRALVPSGRPPRKP